MMKGIFRPARFFAALAAGAVFTLATGEATAQTAVPAAAVEQEDAEIFRPTTDPGDFITVYDSKTMPVGHFSIGFYGDYARNPLEIQRLPDGRRFTRLVQNLGTMQLTGAIGVLPYLQLGARIPGYILDFEDVEAGTQRSIGGTSAALGDIVLNAELTLVDPWERGFGLAVVPELTLPTGDGDEFAGTGKLGWGGLLVGDIDLTDRFRVGLNVGGRVRDKIGGGPLKDPDDAFEDQLLYGGALRYDFTNRYAGIFEVYGATDASDPFGVERQSPVDAIGALRVNMNPVELTFGGGAGLTIGQGSPDFRLFVGITPRRPRPEDLLVGPDLSDSRKTYALIDRDGDNRPSPGDHLEYRIHLINTGDQPAINVVLRDRIPDHTRYVPGSLQIDGTPMTDTAGDDAAEFSEGPPEAVVFRIARLEHTPGDNEATASFRVEIDPEIRSVVTVTNFPAVTADDLPQTYLAPAETQIFPSLIEREHVIVGRDKIELTSNIHFEFDKSRIQPQSYPILRELAEVMRDYPDLRIRIEGHTDSVGTEEYNQGLSERRAIAVYEFLIDERIDERRMEWVGRGELQPIATNDTATGRAMNRRMEFHILNPEALEGLELEKRRAPDAQDLAPGSEPEWLRQQGRPE